MTRALTLCFVLLWPGLAAAHDADIVFIQLVRGEGELVRARVTLTAQSLALLAPVDADDDGRLTDGELQEAAPALRAGVWNQMPLASPGAPCERTAERAALREAYVELGAEYRCAPGELTQTFRILDVLPSNYQVVLGAFGDGGTRQQGFARGHRQTVTVLGAPGTAPRGGSARGPGGWVALGVEHIFLGIDHLAFVLAVILVGGSWKRIGVLVTSFTVAHSITLAAAALGVVRLSADASRWVEVAIALSIIWVAVENLVLKTHRHRALLTFLFGLVHGFGFASVLAEQGLGEQVALGLFGFNLGVELGQAAVVAVLLPVIHLLQRREEVGRWTVRLGSGFLLCMGAFWFVDRLVG
jgi:hypothetical protein